LQEKKVNTFSKFCVFAVILFLAATNSPAASQDEPLKTALLIIDVQDFYFPGGALPLVKPGAAALNIQKLLKKFRDEKKPVIHVRHLAKTGAGIHRDVEPVAGEKVISKNEVNSFKGTDLPGYLHQLKVKRLVICGMQTHMCVEAAVRAAHDLDFEVILVHDACATRDLKFNDKIIKSADVHYSTLSTLGAYAKVLDTASFLKEY
jgi:nicotinamidase-related amidase